MQIRIRNTKEIVYEKEFRALHPNTSFPPQLTAELLDSFGADPVFEGPQATTVAPYQYSQRNGVEQISDKWFTKYVAGPIFTDYNDSDGVLHTAIEQDAAYKQRKDDEQAISVRADRNSRLTETDWRFRSDMTPSQDWIDYCQALRDVTAQAGFPWTITWPETP